MTASPSEVLTLAEALAIAEAVTGVDALTLARVSRLELLDSALHAPQAGFGDDDFYPGFVDKAAVLVVRIARNHPLPEATSDWPGRHSPCSAPSTVESWRFPPTT